MALALGCGVAALILYAATAARGVAWDDGGELGAGVVRLGVVHADGYPAYVLGGWAFTSLEPFGSPAFRASLWSALLAAAAVSGVAYVVAWRSRSLVGGLTAAGLLATGGLYWSQATQPSVYPLFVLSIVLLLIAAYRWDEQRGPGRLAWLAAAAGLVAVSHRSGLLFLPFAAAFVLVRGGRSLARPANVAALGAGLLPWLSALYVPVRAHAHVFPNQLLSSHTDWWHLVTGPGLPYDQPFRAGVDTVATHALNVGVLAVDQLSVAVVVLLPVGVWALRRDPVYLLCGLGPALLLSAIVLTTTGSYPFWHLPLLSALAIAAGTAIPELRRLVRGSAPAARGSARALLAVAGGVLAAAGLTGAVGGGVYVADHGADASQWARGVLAALPRGAQVVAPWSAYAPLRATQELEHRRGDVTVALAHHWPTDAADVGRARGYLVAMDVGPTPVPAGVRLVRVGPRGLVDRKGITGLRFAGRLLGDVQYKAQAYLVERSKAGVGGPAYNR